MLDGEFIKLMVSIPFDEYYFDYYDRIDEIDKKSGIYCFRLCGEIVYAGKSVNLHGRLYKHAKNFLYADDLPDTDENKKYKMLKGYMNELTWEVLEYCDKDILSEKENYYIDLYRPIFNVQVPYGAKQIFIGTIDDIDDYVLDLIYMDDLKKFNIISQKKNWIWMGDRWKLF